MIRAVIDVTVLVSSILGPLGFPRQVMLAWEGGQFRAVVSEGMIGTLEEKLSLPRIRKRFNVQSMDDILWTFRLLQTQAAMVVVPLVDRRVVTGDPEDDLVLATARLGAADHLVTGDNGLLELQRLEGIAIISPRAFVELLSRAG